MERGEEATRAVGKRAVDWDLNNWKWDGDLFVATRANKGSSNSSNEEEEEEEDDDDDPRRLNLELGGGSKQVKPVNGIPNKLVYCQVENCGGDLSKAKDYHRRHKVCEMHSKATNAFVGGTMQRFCQQCSRFHVLDEFDEGKRSCRRRLAGHNKRRRKANPETNPLNEDQTNNILLISLLKLLSNIHTNQSGGEQDLLSSFLKSVVNQAGEHIGKSLVSLLQGGGGGGEASQNVGNSLAMVSIPQQVYANGVEERVVEKRVNNFDLNDTFIDSDDTTNTIDIERSSLPPPPPPTTTTNQGTGSVQSSRNSDSASDQSPPSSSGDVQSRTDRIEFKLFGKEPNDFPVALRGQILDWLGRSPTNIESYIRPGCIVLTIYLRQDESSWEELCCDLSFTLRKLLDLSNDRLWIDGWMYLRVDNHFAFAFNGQIVLEASLPLQSRDYSQLITVRPLAVTGKAQFTVKGINLRRPGIRLLCAVKGTYLLQQATEEKRDDNIDISFVQFSCEMPIANGRGFIEIEDEDGVSTSSLPFIVSDDEDVCSEIRTLESALEFTGTDSAIQATEFIHELGWLLHRSELNSKPEEIFGLVRFKFLFEFSMDQEWYAVIKKLLNLLFEEGTVNRVALSELSLLHRAVRKNSKPMVETLLRFVPKKDQRASGLFRPDAFDPTGSTPLHIAAGKDGSEDVLDALTEDPGMIGVQAWKIARDKTGFTPEDCARLHGRYSYIHLVQRKLNRKPLHTVVDIPESFEIDHKQGKKSGKEMMTRNKECKLCDHKREYVKMQHRSISYRPALLPMIVIAAVCVCVALLFKSCPEVKYVFQPFRWEMLEFGSS